MYKTNARVLNYFIDLFNLSEDEDGKNNSVYIRMHFFNMYFNKWGNIACVLINVSYVKIKRG